MMILLTFLTGFVYPGIVTGFCQVFFRKQADGSLVTRNGRVIGSQLLGQNFARPEYFHPRPSAAGTDGYDPTASGGSNLGPTSQKLLDRMKTSAERFRSENPDFKGTIPVDALTTSGSGLDPDISLANAEAQLTRIANARHINRAKLQQLIAAIANKREAEFLGEPRVNVLEMNLALDSRK